jgi:hypothetical protein
MTWNPGTENPACRQTGENRELYYPQFLFNLFNLFIKQLDR